MVFQATEGMNTWGEYEMRSGRCPDCDTLFDDRAKPPLGDKRYCPKCGIYNLGKIKRTGKIS